MKTILASMFAVFTALLCAGCTVEKPPDPPPPKPAITVTVQENSSQLLEVKIEFTEVASPQYNRTWAILAFSSQEEVKHYREELEFAVVKLREAEEKMKDVSLGVVEKEEE